MLDITVRGRRGAWWLLAAYGALVAVATLTPAADAVAQGPGFWCVGCGDFALADAVANVVLFVPLGWALSRTGVHTGTAIALLAAATVGIEVAQHAVIPGRVASASDLVMNTAGGIVGVALPQVTQWLRASSVRAARGAAAYGALLATSIGAGVALQAMPLPDALRWTRESPRLPGYTDFTGIVRAVMINATPVGEGEWFALGGDDTGIIALDLVSGVPDPRRAEIVSARLRSGPAWVWVDQQGRDLRAHVASASDRLRLRGHSPWMPEAMPAAAGEPVAVRFSAGRFAYDVVVETKGGTSMRHASITPGDGWRLFMPFERRRERWAPLLGALWMAALLAPLGYLATARSAAAVGAAGAGAATYLVLLPLALGCAWLPFAGWCGAVGGFVIGKGTPRWS